MIKNKITLKVGGGSGGKYIPQVNPQALFWIDYLLNIRRSSKTKDDFQFSIQAASVYK